MPTPDGLMDREGVADTRCSEHHTFIKLHLRVCNRTDAPGPLRIFDATQVGSGPGCVGSIDYRAKADQVGMAGL
jgi:hypothetical protein